MNSKLQREKWNQGEFKCAIGVYYSLVNCATMGQAQFLVYPWFICFKFFFGDQTQTSLGQTPNDATYDV